jgi:hypothetical protein
MEIINFSFVIPLVIACVYAFGLRVKVSIKIKTLRR